MTVSRSLVVILISGCAAKEAAPVATPGKRPSPSASGASSKATSAPIVTSTAPSASASTTQPPAPPTAEQLTCTDGWLPPGPFDSIDPGGFAPGGLGLSGVGSSNNDVIGGIGTTGGEGIGVASGNKKPPRLIGFPEPEGGKVKVHYGIDFRHEIE